MKKQEMLDYSPFRHENADDSAGFQLWKITALWQRKQLEVLDEIGITQTQYAILASLRWFEEKKQPVTQTHLVEHAKIDKMTVSKGIRRLEKKDLVLREKSPIDNRSIDVRFTALGRKLIQNAIVAIENADEDFFSCLNAKQMIAYKTLTSELILRNS